MSNELTLQETVHTNGIAHTIVMTMSLELVWMFMDDPHISDEEVREQCKIYGRHLSDAVIENTRQFVHRHKGLI